MRCGHNRKPVTLERILSHCVKVGDCLEWQLSRSKKGYPQLKSAKACIRVHRWVCENVHGPIPTGNVVRHSCDNPPCCNPDHLRAVTQWDNVRDMDNKGRRGFLSGQSHPNSKLTDAQVEAIRLDGRYHREIASDYGVSKTLIGAIKRGEQRK